MNDAVVLRDTYIKADKLMLIALAVNLAVTLVVAAFTDTWGVALAVGLPGLLVPYLLYRTAAGTLPTRLAMASAFMIFSALLIQQTRGQIEAHFGIFVLLAFLLYYRDWLPILVAAAVIAVHHLAFNYLQAAGMGFYVLIGGPSLPIILIHAAYVVAESAMLIYMAISLRRQTLESAYVAVLAENIGAGELAPRMTVEQTRDMPLLATMCEMRTRLVDTMGQVRAGTDKVDNMAGNLTAVAHQADEAIRRQSDATHNIATTIEAVASSVRNLSERADEARKLAQSSGANAASGSRSFSPPSARYATSPAPSAPWPTTWTSSAASSTTSPTWSA